MSCSVSSTREEQDIYHFRAGTYVRAYEKLGAHVIRATQGTPEGTRFAVWAPNADAVTVIGDFNGWERHRHPLSARADSSGIWEGVVAGVGPGTLYKYHVASRRAGFAVDKADPYAFRTELPPRTASVVRSEEHTSELQSPCNLVCRLLLEKK